ncbi:membrane cofactor protein-like isoform X1 [Diceros bicornis minor]|uniref:membrane cofactor protein-like isoform X1 n=1 Tax=Diceros bicornis minor TaxID=77932 RepID=UPI0026F37C46|nr:membrane cofactor protein-like isoform X1 [Diceros bicornis minor]
MTASCAPRAAPPCRPESHFSSWGFVGVLLGALVLLLPVFSDACGPPPTFDSMQLQGRPESLYFPGDKIRYACRSGYEYVFPYRLVTYCERNNSWLPIGEACARKQCPTPEVKNGEVFAPDELFSFDSEAHFSCDEGYYLIGKNILTCKLVGDNVQWNGIIPRCEMIYCSSPGKIKNGKHTNSYRKIFEYNELVTYSCNPSDGPDEYSLVGESKLICSGPDTWSSDPPECKDPEIPIQRVMTSVYFFRSRVEWEVPECTVVKCELPVLEHGRPVSGIRDNFSYQAVVVFECLQGFYLNGSHIVFCGGNSTWEPEMPTCIKAEARDSRNSGKSFSLGRPRSGS